MEAADAIIDGSKQLSPDALPFARSYQLEALEKAIRQNTIVYLETGSGKTLIAVMLLRSYAYLLRKPSPYIAVFLVPSVVLVTQQAEVVTMLTDLKVGKYWGEMGVDYWDAATWKREQEENEVLVMTPQILLDALRHSFFKLDMIKVLIFDECHHARGKHPYACIMTEFYHYQRNLRSGSHLPRILGMTASPIKTKGSSSSHTLWKKICELENLMSSKVYTCVSDSVLAEYIPFSTPKLKIYKHMEIPYVIFERVAKNLSSLKEKHLNSLTKLNLGEPATISAEKRISKLFLTFFFCATELGVWLALKAAEFLSCDESDVFLWGKLDIHGEKIVKDVTLDVFKAFLTCIPSGPEWSIGDLDADMEAGFLTSKVVCLIESLLEYREYKDLRCIIFVERVITAVVLQILLSEVLPKRSGWKTSYMAGNHAGLQSQSRKEQNEIVGEFRKGTVNIIVATSILEEGLDVQTCNLVIRFDPSATVSSFIQSRGRARMRNSDFLLMVRSGDTPTVSRVKNFLASGDIMRKESLSHASLACSPLESTLNNEDFYRVESTGAIVTLSSSIALIYFFCSRLPSDGYFKTSPRCLIDEEQGICTLDLPKSSPISTICVEGKGNAQMLKQIACLKACKQLHQSGALTDNLVPAIVLEETVAQELRNEPYYDEKVSYFPPELVSHCQNESVQTYHSYLIELKKNYEYDVPVHNIFLVVRREFETDVGNITFELEVDRGNLTVDMKYAGVIPLTSEQVHLARRFQTTAFRVLFDRNLSKIEAINIFDLRDDLIKVDYLLLPSTRSQQNTSIIDWTCVSSVCFPRENPSINNKRCFYSMCYSPYMHTKNGLVCACALENSLVVTPHNGNVYCITGIIAELNGESQLKMRDGKVTTYKNYFEAQHGICLRFVQESLLNGKRIFQVQNYLQRRRQQKEKESSKASVELPPELCLIVMSPISIGTFYSFSFLPSIVHRIESLLIAVNLRKMYVDHCTQNVVIPTIKVLEAITTKKCQEKFHLESLETLGDSFLKYSTSQQLFKTYQSHHEGLLSVKKDKIISNVALCKIGCDRKIPGFIRNEAFDPKMWIIPGDRSEDHKLEVDFLSSTRKIYVKGKRKVKSKTVADVVEALIGAFLSTGGEVAALLFMDWLGIQVDFVSIPYERQFPIHPGIPINIPSIESLLNYRFNDRSLLVEALTHGSYMMPEIPGCYQRLEFLGDAVLDYMVTMHLYHKYPGLSPGMITDLRSASVNNDCYALSAVNAGLHKHILHASPELQKHIMTTVTNFKQLSLESTFGWESETAYPKVLGDIIESLAGAILVDSGYNKERVFACIRPLLEPMITPETVKHHPAKELNELIQKHNYHMKEHVSIDKGVRLTTIEVEANGVKHKYTSTASDKNMAKKVASKYVLQSLQQSITGIPAEFQGN